MKIKIFKPKRESPLKRYARIKSDSGEWHDALHFKKPITLKYLCTCKGFIFNLKCKHIKLFRKREKRDS